MLKDGGPSVARDGILVGVIGQGGDYWPSLNRRYTTKAIGSWLHPYHDGHCMHNTPFQCLVS